MSPAGRAEAREHANEAKNYCQEAFKTIQKYGKTLLFVDLFKDLNILINSRKVDKEMRIRAQVLRGVTVAEITGIAVAIIGLVIGAKFLMVTGAVTAGVCLVVGSSVRNGISINNALKHYGLKGNQMEVDERDILPAATR